MMVATNILPRFILPKMLPRIPITYDLAIKRYGATRVSCIPRKGIYIPMSVVTDSRYHVEHGGFHFPLEEAPFFYQILLERYKDLKFTIDDHTREYVEAFLERERRSFAFATAEDCETIPEDFGPIKFRNFQRAALQYLEFSSDNKILALEMGLGKSAVVIAHSERNNLRTLILTKASLIHNMEREIRKLTGKPVLVMRGRYPDDSAMRGFLSKEFQYILINYEIIGTTIEQSRKIGNVEYSEEPKRPWVDVINQMSSLGMIDCIVADEAHNCRNLTAKRTQALMKMKAKKKIPMTGTPIENRVKDLYPLLNWIAPEQFDSVQSFLNVYDDGAGAPKDSKKFQAMLLPYMFRRRKRDVLKDLPAIQRSVHLVDMPDIHKARYKEALAGFFLKWDGSKKDINSALAQLTRLRQVIADAKADATVEWVQDFLEQSTEKLIIFSYYVAPVRQLAAELNCDAIYGDVDPAKRMVMVDAFNNDPSVRVLVIQANTGQTGLNLTAANNVYFNDISWSFTDIEQGEARAYGRLNDLHGANSIRAVVNDTIDKLLSDVIEYKASISNSAIDGANDYATEQVNIMSSFLDKLNELRFNGF